MHGEWGVLARIQEYAGQYATHMCHIKVVQSTKYGYQNTFEHVNAHIKAAAAGNRNLVSVGSKNLETGFRQKPETGGGCHRPEHSTEELEILNVSFLCVLCMGVLVSFGTETRFRFPVAAASMCALGTCLCRNGAIPTLQSP